MREITINQVLPLYKKKGHQNIYQGDCGGCCKGILSPQLKLPNFQYIFDDALPTDEGIYLRPEGAGNRIFKIKNAQTEAISGYLFEGLHTTHLEATSGKHIYNYKGENLISSLSCGVYYLETIDGAYATEWIEVSSEITTVLKWKNTYDIFETLYNTGGFENTLYLKGYEDTPVNDTNEEAVIDGNGFEFIKSSRHVYKRRIITPNIFDCQLQALSHINSHNTKTFVEDFNTIAPQSLTIKTVNFSSEAINNGCMHKGILVLTVNVEMIDNCERNIYTIQ
jgi:hypothetical protein